MYVIDDQTFIFTVWVKIKQKIIKLQNTKDILEQHKMRSEILQVFEMLGELSNNKEFYRLMNILASQLLINSNELINNIDIILKNKG